MKNLSHTQLVIFDLDGTLVDSQNDIAAAANFAMTKIGLPSKTPAEIADCIGGGTHSLVKDLLGEHRDRFEEAFPHFISYYKEHLMDSTIPYPGVVDLLAHLSTQKKLAVLSNKRHAFCTPILDTLSLSPFFAEVYGGDTLPVKKPDPTPILHLCERLGIDPALAVMVGDSPVDVEAGKRAGSVTVGVLGGYARPGDVEKSAPDILLRSLKQLAAFFPTE